MSMTDEEIIDRITFLLVVDQTAQVRTGERRSADAARKLLKAGAKQANVEVKTSSSDGYVSATVK